MISWNYLGLTGVRKDTGMRSVLLSLLLCGATALGQNPEAGRVERHGDRAVLIVDSPRPVDSAAITLAQEFGIRVNVEDPPYVYRDDIKDVTAEVSRTPDSQRRVLIPKGGHLEVRFGLHPDGSPEDIPELLRSLVEAANAQFPFAYRLHTEGSWFTIVPTHTRDVLGQIIEITPLLDRHVTVPRGTRTIAETANLMAAALSAQTGLRVNCCQGFVAGIPWGMAEVTFEAHDEPARSVLKKLITDAAGEQPDRDYWLQRCDALPSTWCFINLAHAVLESGEPKTPSSPPPDRLGQRDRSPWFSLTPPKR